MKNPKILVIRNDHIGDMVLSTIIFRELKKRFPSGEITAIASAENKAIIEKNKSIDKIIILKSSPRKLNDMLNYFRVSKALRRENFDIGIDLRGSFFNALLMWRARVKYKIGFYEQNISKNLLDYCYRRDKSRHETFLIRDLINKSLQMNIKNYWPDIQICSDDKKALKKFVKENKLKKYICICPDASDERKQWPLQNFDSIIKFIHNEYPKYKILLVGSDKKKLDFLMQKNKFCISLIKKNLRLIYLLFKNSKLIISPDGGLVHLAWAAKARLIALVPGYISIKHVGPLGNKSKVLFTAREISSISLNDAKMAVKTFLG